MNNKRYTQYVEMPGSYIKKPDELCIGKPDPEKCIIATAVLFWKTPLNDILANEKRLTREGFARKFNLQANKVKVFTEFLRSNNLNFEISNNIKRYVNLSGKVKDFEKAFNVSLKLYSCSTRSGFIGREGFISVPKELEGIVEGIIGLDYRPKMYLTANNSDSYNRTGYTAKEVASAYNFPNDVSGKQNCIALLHFGGGYRKSDLEHYFSKIGLKTPDVSWVGIHGAVNAASTHNEFYDAEVTMNIEVAGSIANDAKIVTYFAPNTDAGFFGAFISAIHDIINMPTVISICWGAPEGKWPEQVLFFINEALKSAAILGITVCAASGNKGVYDGVNDGSLHVDFPASSPYVLSCGGTQLIIHNGKVLSETAWVDNISFGSGGGISEYFEIPEYQLKSKVPASKNYKCFLGRGVPDVAGNAAPDTGYSIYVNNKWRVIGGTSSVAPLFAGLIALFNEKYNCQLGFINPILYNDPSLCRNISRVKNNNQHCLIYKASPNSWDTITGLGVFYKIKQHH